MPLTARFGTTQMVYLYIGIRSPMSATSSGVLLSSSSVLVLFMEPVREGGMDAHAHSECGNRSRIAGDEPGLSAVCEQERRRDTRGIANGDLHATSISSLAVSRVV